MKLFDWFDEDRFRGFSDEDRLIGALYHLGVADMETLITVSGWPKNKLRGAVDRVREREVKRILDGVKTTLPEKYKHLTKEEISALPDKERQEFRKLKQKIKEERRIMRSKRDEWILIQKKTKGGVNYYSLGDKGFRYALRNLLGQHPGNKRPPQEQIDHYMGINRTLCRLVKAGEPKEWLSTKEVISWLHAFIQKREKLKIHPDAIFTTNSDMFMFIVEYETGANVGAKLQSKFLNYYQFQIDYQVSLPTILFITNPHNIDNLYGELEYARTKYKKKFSTFPFAEIVILEEGEEIDFINNHTGQLAEVEQTEIPEDRISQDDPYQETVWVQEKRELEKQIEQLKESENYWCQKSIHLQNELKQQAEWINQLIETLSNSWRAKGPLEDFIRNHPLPKRKTNE